ncbi:MAG: beta-ketoacyl-[acyl-carrier-protein] synthase II [Caldiserica bacterium]|nr:MAG: beta-ketoacyl-[acyl-carrier-protein] synthase II [Caldisericota bacterium]
MRRRVVVTGIGAITPFGVGVDKFLNGLKEGISTADIIKSFDVSDFPTKFACIVENFKPEEYIEPKKIRRLDRFLQFTLVAAKFAVEDSKIDFDNVDPYRVGVVIGSGVGGLNTIEKEAKAMFERGPRKVSPFLIPMMIPNMASGMVAIEYGARGMNFATVSACASGAHAIGIAFRAIQYGDSDIVITGGSEAAITPLGLAGFCQAKALSTRNDDPKRASRPFDKNRDGFVMGEGAGILILEELEHAKKRGAKIYAEILGIGMTDDAYHMTAPEPNADPQKKVMELAIIDSGIDKDSIDYINAHGTSTKLNDKAETKAIKLLFGEEKARKISISSTKSMVGHLLGAAGAVELIATILCINNSFVHPTINYEEMDPECDLDYTSNKMIEKEINYALSNSFGFGGHNVCLLVGKYRD